MSQAAAAASDVEGLLRMGEPLLAYDAIQQALENTLLGIPAPFNSLDGPIQLKLSVSPDQSKLMSVPFELSMNLKSPNQFFNMVTSGKTSFSNPIIPLNVSHTDFNIEIKGGQFQLPDLRFIRAPRLIPDPRFQPQSMKMS